MTSVICPNEVTVLPVLERDFVRVTGSDATRFLQNYCTCDVTKLADGDGGEAFFPSDKGRILAFGLIERVGDAYFVSGSTRMTAALIGHLAKYAILDDVELVDVASEWHSFLVAGGGAVDVCRAVLEGSSAGRFLAVHEATSEAMRVTCVTGDCEAVRNGLLSTGAVGADDVLQVCSHRSRSSDRRHRCFR